MQTIEAYASQDQSFFKVSSKMANCATIEIKGWLFDVLSSVPFANRTLAMPPNSFKFSLKVMFVATL